MNFVTPNRDMLLLKLHRKKPRVSSDLASIPPHPQILTQMASLEELKGYPQGVPGTLTESVSFPSQLADQVPPQSQSINMTGTIGL